MGFNYAKEKAGFERQWAKLREQYEKLGMGQDTIEELYNFDWDWFRSQRRFRDHLADLPEEVTVETIRQVSTGTIPGDIPASLGMVPHQWLDEIEDEELLSRLMLLSDDDIALLTLLAFEGYTQSEIAQQKLQSQQAISVHLRQIKKIFKKHL